MKAFNPKTRRVLLFLVLALVLRSPVFAQTCPTSHTTNLSGNYPNTFYPATQSSAASGTNTITLGAVTYGSHAITSGDVLLVIQMQGALINPSNSNQYGDATGAGSGYMNDGNLYAGNMEFVVANSSVPTSGGTLTLKNNLKYSYKNQAYNGSFGQYTYQVLYVPIYYNLKLGSQIVVPAWNGSTGGILVFAATDSFNFNGQTILGAGYGFRGGATRELTGGTGTSTEYISMSTINNNGGKGEGMAGTPRFVNSSGTLLDNGSANEGYPLGAEARGAPGNAGGGGTDYDPSQNDQNDGGGGGGNGGIGGNGGNSWSSNQPVGGVGGAVFAQAGGTRLVMGGGGGGGTSNNGTGGSSGIYSSGVSGGGIVIIYAGSISGTGTINVDGSNGYTNVGNDGSGGGGAGGSVLIYASQSTSDLSGLKVTADGGTGGSNSGSGAKHGPGGGGGGGVIISNMTIGSTSAVGGVAGTTYGGVNYGATAGASGVITQNATISQMLAAPVSCTLLPINWLSFTAQPANGNVTLNWVVESQTATGFAVERSFDGNSFDAIGTLPVRAGNDPSNSYSYIDNNASSPTSTLYYRIREEDATGQNFYSSVAKVRTSVTAASSGVYPNPAKESFKLTFNASTAGAVSLRLFDVSGRLMLTQPFQASTGENAVTVNGLETLPDGMYILQWFDGLKPWTSKVMIRH